ncbi:MAG: H4MPT-linked C1 transfer pathway protein [Methylophaga sp.]|nr:MAG: H4MPT-linked C1 transfer pathway protein [Methylophaga sp.]
MISGWDIGGAHLKVARCDDQGNNFQIIQIPCPLWQGIESLEQAIETILAKLDSQHDLTAITMTGELVDIFADRQSGVAEILNCVARYIKTENIKVYGAQAGWLNIEQATQQWQMVASRNWQASASIAAAHQQDGLFIDIGSTTCDIIALINGKESPRGFNDLERQTSRELLYTGAIRTPLISLCQSAPFDGELVGLAAEVFATTGDCWVLLDKLNPKSIQDSSANNKPWNAQYCASRIAHLLGTDAVQTQLQPWQQLAQWFAEQQCHLIINAILHVISSHKTLPANAPIIGAGVGRFIIKMCAQRLGRPYQDLDVLIAIPHTEASDHAAAVAVALLARQQLT